MTIGRATPRRAARGQTALPAEATALASAARPATPVLLAVVVLVAMFALLAGAGPARGQSKVGTTVGGFLRIEPGARAAALGNAGAALPGTIEAVYYNAGAIGLLERPAVQYSHSFWFADISFDYAAFALPVSGNSTLFASVTALNSGEMDVRTVEQPLGTGERYTVANTALAVGYGVRITSRFAAGLQVNYATERIWHSSLHMFTMNMGTMYRLSESGILLAFSLANVGPRAGFDGDDLAIRYDADPDRFGDNSSLPAELWTDDFPLPGVFRLGLSVPFRPTREISMLFLAEALHPNDNSESVNVGLEWAWRDLLALRAGYQTLFQTDRELGLTLGFGIQGYLGNNRYHVDYAWADHDHLQDTHRVSVVLVF
ncbi:MAG: PorV/PorQ family protein [Candidatus Krumholzibacteriia bacterium]